MKTIVVGYDALPSADRALDRAVELAKALSARVHVVSVGEFLPIVEPLASTSLGGPALMEMPPWATGVAAEDLAERMLAKARERLGGSDVEVEYQALTGVPDEALIREADRVDADLIVVGTREPGFLDRLFAGDTTVDVMRRSHRDVLVVHGPHKPAS
jgi:nucleotide-binding universal stress UspA family protein